MIKQTIPLSIIIGLRFFGLFVVMPVLSYYALLLEGSTEILVGLTIGAYALTQILFQIPFSRLSDKIGRKKTIAIGLIIFTIGSIIAGISEDIYTLLLGRLIQGAGAIAAVISATISDLVEPQKRTKAMAMMGGAIAMSFLMAMIIGPIIAANYGLNALFFLTAGLTFISLVLLLKVPTPPIIKRDDNKKFKAIDVLKDSNIFTMAITNFLQKAIMTLTFVIIPVLFINALGWAKEDLVYVYIPATILAIGAMGFASIKAERYGKFKEMLQLGIALFILSYTLFGFTQNEVILIIAITIFFIGFNIHEPILQSLTSKYAPAHQRAVALGVFNIFGYAGTFIGGMFGGLGLSIISLKSIAIIIIMVSLIWIYMISKITNPVLQKKDGTSK